MWGKEGSNNYLSLWIICLFGFPQMIELIGKNLDFPFWCKDVSECSQEPSISSLCPSTVWSVTFESGISNLSIFFSFSSFPNCHQSFNKMNFFVLPNILISELRKHNFGKATIIALWWDTYLSCFHLQKGWGQEPVELIALK